MDRSTFDQLRTIDTTKALAEFRSTLAIPFNTASVIAAAYVLLDAGEYNLPPLDNMELYFKELPKPESRVTFLRKTLEPCWESLEDLFFKISREELQAIILFYEATGNRFENDTTPDGVIRLALNLLNIQEGDRVADFGTGHAAFLREAFREEPGASYYGIELDPDRKEIASIRAELLGDAIQIEQGNILDLPSYQRRFDVAFAHYPFGIRAKGPELAKDKELERLMSRLSISKSVSMDWLYNAAVAQSINGPRRAVCIMTNGGTWNTLDKIARKYFLHGGNIEAVIALPERVFEYTNIATTMIVFSHGNTGVMMVDARNLCEKGRRLNTITKDYAEKIAGYCETESEYSRFIPYEELEQNDYILNPARYFSKKLILDGIPFGSVIKSITRGAPIKASDLDDLVSEQETDFQYLMLKNIQDGIIEDKLPYLKEIDLRMEKHCIHDHNLILSKNGAPFKVAIANVPEGKKVLANGNLFVIELDQEKVDPYFVLAFLESDLGKASLDNITVGATIPTISVEQLKQIQIPNETLEKQREIGRTFVAKLNLVKIMRDKLDSITDSLKHMMDEYRAN